MRCALLVLLTIALSACNANALPYKNWWFSVGHPRYMQVWVEEAMVTDTRGQGPYVVPVGIASGADATEGWTDTGGMGVPMNIGLPKTVTIRWQSLVEPQAYRVTLQIPESVRKLMIEKGVARSGTSERDYQNALGVGLAPGGVVKVWVFGAAAREVPVMCVKAEIEPAGPYGGRSHGKFRALSTIAQAYLQTHPIPYDSWKCDK